MKNTNQRVDMLGRETFVLVHGATGSADIWNFTADFLRGLGHKVYAVNLPGHGVNIEPIEDQDMNSYGEYVAKFIEQLGDKVILVGHSMGGAVITAAGELVPDRIKKIVYMAAWMLMPGQSCNHPDTSYEPHDFYPISEDGKIITYIDRGPDYVPPALYSHVLMERMEQPEPRRREAIAALYQSVYPTVERWGSIRRFYIKSLRDECIVPETQDKMMENWPCERVYELDTGHCPQYTLREQLCVILHDIARLA